MRITVLGKSPSWQDAGGACSGYLIQEGEHALLLDCGNGVFSKLRRFLDYVDVSAVVISHLHADHFLDLVPFSYALTYAPRQQPVAVGGWPGTDKPARPQLFAPVGAGEVFRQIVGCWGQEDLIEHAFELHEYDAPGRADGRPVQPQLLRGAPLHRDVRGRCTLERQPDDLQRRLQPERRARGVRARDRHAADRGDVAAARSGPAMRGHLTPSEAGDHGRRAGARKLVITHFSDELDADWAADRGARGVRRPGRARRRGRRLRALSHLIPAAAADPLGLGVVRSSASVWGLGGHLRGPEERRSERASGWGGAQGRLGVVVIAVFLRDEVVA